LLAYSKGDKPVTVQIDLDFAQVKGLVDRLPEREKEELARYLDDQTLFEELRRVQTELKRVPISMRQITAEVKAVRKARASRARSN
jgi:hypothetical protein